MKRVFLRYIAPIAIGLSIPSAIFAASAVFSGPTTQPTGGNVPGVIWNMVGGGTQPGAVINIDGAASMGSANIAGQASAGNIMTNTNDSNIRKNILLEPNKNYLNLYDNDFSSEKENLLILKFGKKNIFGHTE